MLEKVSNIRQLFCRYLQLSSQLQWNQSIGSSIVSPQGTNCLSETKMLRFFFITVAKFLTSVCLEINKYHARISTTFYSFQVVTSVRFSHLKCTCILSRVLASPAINVDRPSPPKGLIPLLGGISWIAFCELMKSISLTDIALANPKTVIAYPSLAASLKVAK